MDEKELHKKLVESALKIGMLHSGILVIGQKIGGGLIRCMQVEVRSTAKEGEETDKPSVSVLLHPYVIPPYLVELEEGPGVIDVKDSSVVGEYRTPSPTLRDAYVSRVFGESSPTTQAKGEVQ